MSSGKAGWKTKRLGDILTLRKEVIHPHDRPQGVARFVGLEHTESGTGFRSGDIAMDLSRLTGRKPKFYKGDIVYGYLRPYLNKVWVAEFDGLCSVDQYVYWVNAEEADADFIAWFMRSPVYLERAPVKATPGQLPRIRTEEVASVEINIPPVSEQRKIVEILSKQMAELRQAQTAATDQLRAVESLPSALLRAIFNSPEAETWERKRLGEICQLLPAKSIANSGDTPVQAITTACLTESGFDPAQAKEARMWARDAAGCVVSEGEILVARSNTPHLVGRVSMFEGEPKGAVASDLTIRILPHPDMCPRFVSAYLSFLYLSGYWRERAGGASGSMKKITRKQILELPIHVPTLQGQMRIASELSERMSGVKVLRKAVQDQLDALKKMPAALLRRTFNGGGDPI